MKNRKIILIPVLSLAIILISFVAFRRIRTNYYVNGYFKEARWNELKDLHATYKKKNHLTIFFGNSITENFKFFLPESDSLFNMGISGDFSEGLVKRLNNVTRLKPDHLFIKIGINDIVERVPLSKIKTNYLQILDRVATDCPDTKIYIQSTLPTRDLKSYFRSSKDINKIVQKLNTFLKTQAQERALTFVDLYPDFADENNEMKKELTNDGVHLNETGYNIWKKHLSKYISI